MRGAVVDDEDGEALRLAVEALHGCAASYWAHERITVPGTATHRTVYTFLLHPVAPAIIAFAFLEPVPDAPRETRPRIVLLQRLAHSPLEAVRFAARHDDDVA